MEDDFDVVTVGVFHEGGVVAGGVVFAVARCAVIGAAGGDGGFVEFFHFVFISDAKGDVIGLLGAVGGNPQIGFPRLSESSDFPL